MAKQYDFSSASGMQEWLWDYGYFKQVGVKDKAKAVDGKFGNNSKAALAKAQDYLRSIGLYSGSSDGIFTRRDGSESNTTKAFKNWAKGWTKASIKNGSTFEYNRYVKDHIRQLSDWAKKKGVGIVTLGGYKFNLGNSESSLDNMYQASLAAAAGKKYSLGQNYGDSDVSRGEGTKDWSSVSKASGEWKSSYSNTDLDNLVMRYAFDKYHGIKTDDNQWGISYNYTPTNTATSGFGITLKISNKYTPEQAERIARGAGMKNYKYNGQSRTVNLFAGSSYKSEADFNQKIKALEQAGRAAEAQKLYNAELARQYQTYGIDYNMLTDKHGRHWNNLFGVVPYGYNAPSMNAILTGKQAYQAAGQKATASGASTSIYGYRYDGSNQGRFKYNNFDEWYKGRILADKNYHHQLGISPYRAVTSTYYWGLPVAKDMRGQLKFTGARENSATQIDRTNYYDITAKGHGADQMQAWIYNEALKNPQAAYAYMKYIYGDRKAKTKNGKTTYTSSNDRNYKFDAKEATRLAGAAGMTPYHLASGTAPWKEEKISVPLYGEVGGSHDIYESLKTFYENAFDENGNLNKDFSYAENGYNHGYDGGAYTVVIRNGKPKHAEDYWNIDLGGNDFSMNAGVGGKGLPSITRFQMFGGRLLQFCKVGSKMTEGVKSGSEAGTGECAEWSNTLLRDNGYDISGNAWGLNGVDVLFNGYEGLTRPESYDKSAVHRYNQAASRNVLKNFDSKTLNPDEAYVVNMYYTGSKKQEEAYNNGKGVAGTHTGVLTNENGRWVVTHNIHGKIYKDDFLGLQGRGGKYGVTAIYSPKKANLFTYVKQGARAVKGFFGFRQGGLIYQVSSK